VLGHCPLLVSYQAKFCKVSDNEVGAVLAEDLRVVTPGYDEAARPAHLSSGDGILYDDGPLRERPSIPAASS
jgi:hypothetical protein